MILLLWTCYKSLEKCECKIFRLDKDSFFARETFTIVNCWKINIVGGVGRKVPPFFQGAFDNLPISQIEKVDILLPQSKRVRKYSSVKLCHFYRRISSKLYEMQKTIIPTFLARYKWCQPGRNDFSHLWDAPCLWNWPFTVKKNSMLFYKANVSTSYLLKLVQNNAQNPIMSSQLGLAKNSHKPATTRKNY